MRNRKKTVWISSIIIIIILAAAILYFMMINHKSENQKEVKSTTSTEQQETESKPTEQQRTESSLGTESDMTETESQEVSKYDFSKPVPESDPVDNDYFDDAVFIGDSRTEGMLLYTGLSNAVSYTEKGLMVDTVFTKPVVSMGGKDLSVMDALKKTKFNKVYIMFGINETGWARSDIFIEKYSNIIDEAKKINPNAVIYVQEILPVSSKVSKTHSYITNEKIDEYNGLIRKMTKKKEVYYVDVAEAVSDNEGCLPEDAATDGIHLKKPYCEKWLDYLKTHTIELRKEK